MLRRKVLYLLILTIVGVLSILYDVYIMSILFLLILFLPMVLLGIALNIRKGMLVQLGASSKITNKGTNIELRITVKNTTIFPINKMMVQIRYAHQYEEKVRKETIYISADGNSEQTLFVSLVANYCGNIVAKVNFVRIYDYLGIFSLKKLTKQEVKISVLPEYVHLERNIVRENPNVLIQSEVFSSTKSGDDPSEIFSIHEYKDGDRLNHIHWKLSLKQDAIMVKDFALPKDCSVIILVELCASGLNYLERIDKVLELVLSISFSMILNGQQHYIAWFDLYSGICKRVTIEQEENLYEVFSYLYESDLYDRTDAVIKYHFAEFEKEQYTNIIYVTPLLSEDALQELEETKRNAWCHVIEAGKDQNLTEEVLKRWGTSYGMSVINESELYVQ